MKLENIKKTIKDLESKGYEVFYTKSNDVGSVKLYEDEKQVIYVNHWYSYIDIITK